MNSEQRTPLPTIRYVLFGCNGVGKTTLGNAILGINAFDTSFSFDSFTKEPFSHSNIVNGVKIIVTDTVGLTDPTIDDEKILKDLSSYFQNDFQGPINYFLIPHRFSPKGYSLAEEIIVEKGFIDKKTFDGIQIIATLIHRKRTKFTSFDKKTTTYSEWENIDGQKPRSLCIQNAEYGKQEEEENEINETQDNTKIKRTIHYLFRKKRFQRKNIIKKKNKKKQKKALKFFMNLQIH